MGKRHRRKRQRAKVLAFRFGIRETELGELKARVSKAEARRILVERRVNRDFIEQQIVEELIARSTAEIQAIEDAAFFESLEHAANL